MNLLCSAKAVKTLLLGLWPHVSAYTKHKATACVVWQYVANHLQTTWKEI